MTSLTGSTRTDTVMALDSAAARGSATRRLWLLTKPDRPRLFAAALLGALALGCAVGLLATASWLISKASLQPPVMELTIAVVAVRAFGIGRGLFRYAERLVGHDAAFRGLAHVRARVVDRCAEIAPSGLATHRRGDLLTRLVADVDAAVDLTVRVILPGISAAIVGVGATLLATWLLPAAGLVMAVMLGVGGIVVPWITARLGQGAQRRLAPLSGEYTSAVVATLEGLADIVSYGGQQRALAHLADIDQRATDAALKSSRSLGVGSALAALTLGAGVLASLLLGIAAVQRGDVPGVQLAVVALLPLAAYEAVIGLPAAWLAMSGIRVSAARVMEVLDAEDVLADPARPSAIPKCSAPAESTALIDLTNRDALVLSGVTVSYPGASEHVIEGLDLRVSRGQRVAIVGESGAGKSTIAATLMRYVPYEGSITFRGVELSSAAGDSVREHIGMLDQTATIFPTTIAGNLRIAAPDATDDALLQACERVGLGELLAELPHGLATHVGTHGARLSGGQRQRLSAARLLLARRDVLVFDEPTEHLDDVSAENLVNVLLAEADGAAVLLITHRIVGLADFDEIVVLDNGSVRERGTHAELLARGGSYAAMVRAQSRLDLLAAR